MPSLKLLDAEYVYLRTEAVVRVPTSIEPAKYAPLLCAGVTVFAGMRNLRIAPGETVAVQGLGGLGHLAVQYASKMGYRVVVLSSSGKKEAFAKECGASDYIDGSKHDHAEALQKLGGAALIVATSPDMGSISKLIGGLDKGGKLLVLGGEFSPTFLLLLLPHKSLLFTLQGDNPLTTNSPIDKSVASFPCLPSPSLGVLSPSMVGPQAMPWTARKPSPSHSCTISRLRSRRTLLLKRRKRLRPWSAGASRVGLSL